MSTNLPPRLQSDLTRQRQAYHQELEAQLGRWRADIATMEAEMSAGASVQDQVALQQQLTNIKAKLERAKERLDKMKDTTGDAWAELQTDVANIHQNVSNSVDQAQKEFQRIS
jgi:chromosome segregation ATPase